MSLDGQLFMWSFVGGLAGTALMDAVKWIGHSLHLIGGVKMDMLGRWSLGMLRGRFVYADIHHAPAFQHEIAAGWLFHYFTGGLVALIYPLLLIALHLSPQLMTMRDAILFGLATSLLPWFIVYPAFGKGWFGVRAPKSAKPVLTSLVSHTFYGAGIGLVLQAMR